MSSGFEIPFKPILMPPGLPGESYAQRQIRETQQLLRLELEIAAVPTKPECVKAELAEVDNRADSEDWYDYRNCPGHLEYPMAPRESDFKTQANGRVRERIDLMQQRHLLARQMCNSCVVIEPCRRYALSEPEGTFNFIAGMNGKELRRQKHVQRRSNPSPNK